MPLKQMHPTFQKMNVVSLSCRFCDNLVCQRGMKAILLADTKVELYSTDFQPQGAICSVGNEYSTANCKCMIQDTACLKCGNVVGYHVISACKPCLQSCNNGHYWMFHSSSVVGMERVDFTGSHVLLWSDLPSSMAEEERLLEDYYNSLEECCR
ncbi:protein FAM72A [Lingula anatina]|uniref:Protein FAM72A n=1 Tax=Lingula anatina TaxID=7574 RepID=A0A1S3JSB9_LINAN|nr:protein FAM72A [Lingula anatina]|eukprot:XP_013413001.1 protein FAM72A [Lingula anatina]